LIVGKCAFLPHCTDHRRPPEAQRRRPRRGVRSHAHQHSPPPSRSALEILLLCHAGHGRGLGGGEPIVTICTIICCQENNVRKAFEKNNICTLPTPIFTARAIEHVCSRQVTPKKPFELGAGNVHHGRVEARTRARIITSGLRVLELAVPWKNARSSLTSVLTSCRPEEGENDTNSVKDYRDGRSGEIWRRRFSGLASAG
jgi:hypothetical protein